MKYIYTNYTSTIAKINHEDDTMSLRR